MATPGPSWWGPILYVILIIIFTYFYTAVIMNVHDMADNLKKYGNYIPGIRPGKPTYEYLERVISRITLAGGIFLAAVAVFQYVIPSLSPFDSFTLISGTSPFIILCLGLQTKQAIQAQLLL